MAVKVDHQIELTLRGEPATHRHDELPHADPSLPFAVYAEAWIRRHARIDAAIRRAGLDLGFGGRLTRDVTRDARGHRLGLAGGLGRPWGGFGLGVRRHSESRKQTAQR